MTNLIKTMKLIKAPEGDENKLVSARIVREYTGYGGVPMYEVKYIDSDNYGRVEASKCQEVEDLPKRKSITELNMDALEKKINKIEEEVVVSDEDKTIIAEIVEPLAMKEKVIEGNIKPRMSLLPQAAILEVAKVLTYGANKYDAYNFSKGEEDTTYADACLRHINQYLMNNDIDNESKCHHLAHAAANLLMALDNILVGKSIDNRNKVYSLTNTNITNNESNS